VWQVVAVIGRSVFCCRHYMVFQVCNLFTSGHVQLVRVNSITARASVEVRGAVLPRPSSVAVKLTDNAAYSV